MTGDRTKVKCNLKVAEEEDDCYGGDAMPQVDHCTLILYC